MLSIQELRNLKLEELFEELANARRKLFEIRAGIKAKKIKAVHRERQMKKYIARLLTIVTEYQNELKLKEEINEEKQVA